MTDTRPLLARIVNPGRALVGGHSVSRQPGDRESPPETESRGPVVAPIPRLLLPGGPARGPLAGDAVHEASHPVAALQERHLSYGSPNLVNQDRQAGMGC